jgi:hypothetical protein
MHALKIIDIQANYPMVLIETATAEIRSTKDVFTPGANVKIAVKACVLYHRNKTNNYHKTIVLELDLSTKTLKWKKIPFNAINGPEIINKIVKAMEV